MPIYEYQCRRCAHQFETMQRMSEPALTECPECGVDSLRKLISPVAFRLKGGGWYETDFKKGDARNVIKSEPSGDKEGETPAKKDDKDASPKSNSDSKSNGEGAASNAASKTASKSESKTE